MHIAIPNYSKGAGDVCQPLPHKPAAPPQDSHVQITEVCSVSSVVEWSTWEVRELTRNPTNKVHFHILGLWLKVCVCVSPNQGLFGPP